MKKLLILLILAISTHCFAQDWPVKKMVMTAKANKVSFTSLPAFSFIANKTLTGRGTYQQLSLNPSFSKLLMEQRPDAITINIPLSSKQSINCDLVKFSLGNIKVTENNDRVVENLKIPVTYRGIITGMKGSNTVILTVNEEYLSLEASMTGVSIQVSKADETNSSTYRLYNSASIKFPPVSFNCGTNISPSSKTIDGIDLTGVQVNPLAVEDKCVNVFVDCFDSLYFWQKSNTQRTTNYVYELFNLVAAGFFNAQINVQITAINVWTTKDPYRGDVRANALYDLANYWKDNFWGNICVGLDYSSPVSNRFGRAGAIGKVKAVSANTCPAFNYSGTDSISACIYNDLNYGGVYTNFPTGPNTTQGQVYSTMHEIGHLLGAHHTHWCGWKISSNPDVFGAIDSCATPEGNCMKGPPPAAGSGTIMSYCNGNVGVDYYNGFGMLPGNAIRNFVDQSVCILNCIDCFGVRNINNKELYAFQNNAAAIKKRKPDDEDNSNGQTKKPPTAGYQFINTQKIKQ